MTKPWSEKAVCIETVKDDTREAVTSGDPAPTRTLNPGVDATAKSSKARSKNKPKKPFADFPFFSARHVDDPVAMAFHSVTNSQNSRNTMTYALSHSVSWSRKNCTGDAGYPTNGRKTQAI